MTRRVALLLSLSLLGATASAQKISFAPAPQAQMPGNFTIANDLWSTQPGTCNVIQINSGSPAFTAGQAGRPGRWVWSSSASANSGAFCTFGATAAPNAFLLSPGDTYRFELQFSITTTTNTTLRIGFNDTVNENAPVDGAWINVAGTTLTGMTSSNSSASTTATNFTVSAGTSYRAVVKASGATLVTFELWAVPAGAGPLWSDSLATNIPTGTGRETGLGWVITNSAGGTIELAAFDWYGIQLNPQR